VTSIAVSDRLGCEKGENAMNARLLYPLGDLAASLITGALAGLAAWAIVEPGWNMLLAMILAMIVGMVIGLVAFFPAAIVLGAMEAMVPLMFNGMLAGMVVGMMAAMMPMDMGMHAAIHYGMLSALAGMAFVWLMNAVLRGITSEGEGE
jgi:hypothetical protein